MATNTKTNPNNISCSVCMKSYTKETLGKHNGMCGRCFNKKTDLNTTQIIPNHDSLRLELPSQLLLPSLKLTNNELVSPNLKLANMTISESKAPTISIRLDNWYNANKSNNLKNKASLDFIYTLIKPNVDNLEKIPNVHLINFEKLISNAHKILSE